MAKKQITTCNWWGYISLRVDFSCRCYNRGVKYIEIYRAPIRKLYCESHRAVLIRYGNQWEIKQPVYVSTFCGSTKCVYKGTCAECFHNLDNIEPK